MTSRMGAILLFLLIMNLTFALVQAMGFTTGGVAAYYSLETANETFSNTEIDTKITGISLIDDTFFGISLVTDTLTFLKDIAVNLTFGAHSFYHSLLTMAGGDDPNIGILATILTVLQYFIILTGLFALASNRDSGI